MKNNHLHAFSFLMSIVCFLMVSFESNAMPVREITTEEPYVFEDEIVASAADKEDIEGEGWDDPEKWRSMEVSAAGTATFSDFSHKSADNVRKGIDVSSHNGAIDWNKVASSGVEFAIIRAAYRGYGTAGKLQSDKKFVQNITGAKAAGLKVGAYIFSQAITVEEGKEEANYLLEIVNGYQIDLPLVIDFEYYTENGAVVGRLKPSLGKRISTDICKGFCETVKNAGYSSMVYANKSTLSTNLYASEFDRVWLAHYTSRTDYSGNYDFWQCSESGNVNGISGKVDLDFWYESSEYYSLDVNGLLNGASEGTLGDCGTFDLYLNGNLVSDDKNDYYNARVEKGTTYEIKDIKANSGAVYKGITEGSLSGTVNGNICVRLSFVNCYYLDVNGLLNGASLGDLGGHGSFDLYLNGNLVSDDKNDYYNASVEKGTTYEIKDIKVNSGSAYKGVTQGALSGIVNGNVTIQLSFVSVGSEMSSGGERIIPDGDYLIAATASPSTSEFYYLNIEGTAQPAANGTNVSLCGPLSSSANIPSYEIWTLKYGSDGFYTISQYGTDTCLAVSDGSREREANVWVCQANGSSAQKWKISNNGVRGYRIQAKCSGYSLDILGGTIADGKNVAQWMSNDTDAQSWMFIPYKPTQTLAEGRYVILNAKDTSMELNIPGETGELENGANIQLWKDNGASSRYNSFDVKKESNGYYILTHVASGLEVSSLGGTSTFGQNIGIYEKNGHPAHEWAITKDGDNGGYVLRTRCSGLAMDAEDAGTINGTNVRQWPYNGTVSQTWVFVPAEYMVTYNANGGTGAPSNQTKYYKEDLALSDSCPLRSGYEFIGWGETSTSKSAYCQPGDAYTNDANLSLFALWKKLEPDCVLPANLTIIEEEAFAGASFYYVRLSEKTTAIRSRAFAGCENLKHVYIPEATTMIQADAFDGVENLVIHGKADSYASFYASKLGFTFVED